MRPAGMAKYVIGVDGGNSKTDVVVASLTGELLARIRGGGVDSPLADPDAWREHLASVVGEARTAAGVAADTTAVCAAYFLANVDLPVERRIARAELRRIDQADLIVVQNDTLAILRAGATRPWGIAVVSGAGINAVGVHPSGRTARFLALGDYSGDAGGGHSLGLLGLAAAVRAKDGRGPATRLAIDIPIHYGVRRPDDVAIAVHRGVIDYDELHALAPVVLAAATAGDEVAIGIVRTLADEIGVMASALIRRLRLRRTDVEVVLGGGVLQAGHAGLLDRVTERILTEAPRAQLRILSVAPVFGAVVEAFRQLGRDDVELSGLRAELTTGR